MLAGAGGLVLAVFIYALASAVEPVWPHPMSEPPFDLLAGLLLSAISIAETPLMVFGLRQLARRAPRALSLLLAAFYVAFGAVYAAFLLILTGKREWAIGLAALCVARYVSLLWARPKPI